MALSGKPHILLLQDTFFHLYFSPNDFGLNIEKKRKKNQFNHLLSRKHDPEVSENPFLSSFRDLHGSESFPGAYFKKSLHSLEILLHSPDSQTANTVTIWVLNQDIFHQHSITLL